MARNLRDILANEKPEVVAEARRKADEMLLEIHLSEFRKMMEKTQMEIAEAMGVKQPTVAGMEQFGKDIRLSSLKKYVEATGAKLNLDFELPDGTHYAFHV